MKKKTKKLLITSGVTILLTSSSASITPIVYSSLSSNHVSLQNEELVSDLNINARNISFDQWPSDFRSDLTPDHFFKLDESKLVKQSWDFKTLWPDKEVPIIDDFTTIQGIENTKMAVNIIDPKYNTARNFVYAFYDGTDVYSDIPYSTDTVVMKTTKVDSTSCKVGAAWKDMYKGDVCGEWVEFTITGLKPSSSSFDNSPITVSNTGINLSNPNDVKNNLKVKEAIFSKCTNLFDGASANDIIISEVKTPDKYAGTCTVDFTIGNNKWVGPDNKTVVTSPTQTVQLSGFDLVNTSFKNGQTISVSSLGNDYAENFQNTAAQQTDIVNQIIASQLIIDAENLTPDKIEISNPVIDAKTNKVTFDVSLSNGYYEGGTEQLNKHLGTVIVSGFKRLPLAPGLEREWWIYVVIGVGVLGIIALIVAIIGNNKKIGEIEVAN